MLTTAPLDRPSPLGLYAWVIRFRPSPTAEVQTWIRFYPTEVEARAGAHHVVYRQYGSDAEIVSVALAAVGQDPRPPSWWVAALKEATE